MWVDDGRGYSLAVIEVSAHIDCIYGNDKGSNAVLEQTWVGSHLAIAVSIKHYSTSFLPWASCHCLILKVDVRKAEEDSDSVVIDKACIALLICWVSKQE